MVILCRHPRMRWGCGSVSESGQGGITFVFLVFRNCEYNWMGLFRWCGLAGSLTEIDSGVVVCSNVLFLQHAGIVDAAESRSAKRRH